MSEISVTPGGSTTPPSASRQSSICKSPDISPLYAWPVPAGRYL
jgi:hypothetical protein